MAARQRAATSFILLNHYEFVSLQYNQRNAIILWEITVRVNKFRKKVDYFLYKAVEAAIKI